MHYLSLLFLLTLLAGCYPKHVPPQRDPKWLANREVLKERPSDALTFAVEEYAVGLKYDKRLHLEHAYACVNEEGPIIKLEFITQHILELCEARQLLVDVVEGLVDKLNTNYIEEEFRPYPFAANQIELKIIFESFYVIYDDPMYIGEIVLEDGMSYFYAANVKNDKLDCWDAHQEPYFKSASIAHAQRTAEKEYKMAHQKPASALGKDIYRPEIVSPYRQGLLRY